VDKSIFVEMDATAASAENGDVGVRVTKLHRFVLTYTGSGS
jgi:hypothetical protein